MEKVTIQEYTNNELDYLADMIKEKLTDMGHENIDSFFFSLLVEFESTES